MEDKVINRHVHEEAQGEFDCPQDLMEETPAPDPEPEEQTKVAEERAGQQTRFQGQAVSRVTATSGEGYMKEEQFEDVNAFDDENEFEEEAPRKANRKAKVSAPKKNKTMRMVIFGLLGFVVLAGGAYVAMTLMATPQQQMTYQRPQPAQRPEARKPAARAETPARPAREEGPSAGREQAARPTARAAEAPAAPAAAPAQVSMNEESVRLINDLTSELKTMTPLLRQIVEQGGREAPGSEAVTDDGMKKMLAEMTADLRKAENERKQLQADLEKSKQSIDKLTKENAELKKKRGQSGRQDKPRSEKKREARVDASKIEGWEILGFSGNRVVVATEKGTKSVNLGGTLDGVKILSIDVEGGIVKTNAGTLKYGY